MKQRNIEFEFVHQIIRNNHRSLNGKLYISKALFVVLTDSKSICNYLEMKINGVDFIEIASIPEETRIEYGLFRTDSKSRLKEDEAKVPREFHKKNNDDNLRYRAKLDIINALRTEKSYRHEFLDYFIDLKTIKKKSRTLSIIRTIAKGDKCDKYKENIFYVLNKWNVECEFPLDHYKNFYSKYCWYLRVGPVLGLIDKNNNPNNY